VCVLGSLLGAWSACWVWAWHDMTHALFIDIHGSCKSLSRFQCPYWQSKEQSEAALDKEKQSLQQAVMGLQW
jgi:hypothetical protein